MFQYFEAARVLGWGWVGGKVLSSTSWQAGDMLEIGLTDSAMTVKKSP